MRELIRALSFSQRTATATATTSITSHHRHIRPFVSTQFNSLRFCSILWNTIWNQLPFQTTNQLIKKIKQNKKRQKKNLDGLSVLPCSLSIVYSILINSFWWIFSRHAALIISEDFSFMSEDKFFIFIPVRFFVFWLVFFRIILVLT